MALFDLSAVVAQMTTHIITVRRFATDTYGSNGVANVRVSTAFTTKANVQPITGRDLARLPEGTNASERVSVWTLDPLQLRDRLTISGFGDFEVEHLEQWGANGNYTKAVAKQLDEVEPRP